jgi:hypothetical protein
VRPVDQRFVYQAAQPMPIQNFDKIIPFIQKTGWRLVNSYLTLCRTFTNFSCVCAVMLGWIRPKSILSDSKPCYNMWLNDREQTNEITNNILS